MRIESIKIYREPINLVIADMSPRIGAKNPPPIKSIRIEPITMCWPRLYGIDFNGGGAVFGTSGTFFSASLYVCTTIIPKTRLKIIVSIPITWKGKNVRIVIAGKHSPASSHAPPPTGGVPEAETSQALIITLEGLPSCWSSPTPCITEKRTAKIPKMRETAYSTFID